MLCCNCFQDRPAGPEPCPLCGFDPKTAADQWKMPAGSILAGRWLVGRGLREDRISVTCRALDLTAKRAVAIRMFWPCALAFVTSAPPEREHLFRQALARFREEAYILARLRGVPGAVQLCHYWEENGTGYYAREPLEGAALAERDWTARPMPWHRAMRAMLPVCDALGALHRSGCLHPDLRPGSLLLCRDGAIRLLDLGTGGYDLGDLPGASLDMMDRLRYMPPEAIRRKRGDRGPWTDVYSLAVILYEMIAGRPPCCALDREMREEELVPPSAQGIDLPPQAEAALLRGLALVAKDRWQSMEDWKHALLQATAGFDG